MRFTAVLSRTARTEWRTAPIKGTYKPGKTFGFLVRRVYASFNWKNFVISRQRGVFIIIFIDTHLIRRLIKRANYNTMQEALNNLLTLT